MSIDPGVAIGIAGSLLAAISLVYARTQAHAQRRQVEEMQRQTEETRRAQHFETSHTLMKDAINARQTWVQHFRLEWVPAALEPQLQEALRLLDGDHHGLFAVRVYIEYLQEMYFARKNDLVADDHWHVMHRLVRGFFTLEIDRKLFSIFTDIGWITDEFANFGRAFASTSVWTDPLNRIPQVHDIPLDQPMRRASI